MDIPKVGHQGEEWEGGTSPLGMTLQRIMRGSGPGHGDAVFPARVIATLYRLGSLSTSIAMVAAEVKFAAKSGGRVTEKSRDVPGSPGSDPFTAASETCARLGARIASVT